MPDPVLWSMEPHTAAKHRVLRAYVDAWMPVMAQQALEVNRRLRRTSEPIVLMVDAFAGPGRYVTGEPGSPLILLDAVLSHSAFPRLSGVQFRYLFIEHDLRRVDHLRQEIRKLGHLPDNVSVRIESGEFENVVGPKLEMLRSMGHGSAPTFAFVDPFGYSYTSMNTTGRLLEFPRCEALFFLPLSFISRFVGRAGQEQALNSLFGCNLWTNAVALSGSERSEYLLGLFERQLKRNQSVEYVRSFELRTNDGQDYRLVFGLGHIKGLELAKDAMWKVDPVAGTSFVSRTASGLEVPLFRNEELVNTWPLLQELHHHFGTGWFTTEDAARFTLEQTDFRVAHLRRKTLAVAEERGILEVVRARPRSFERAHIRFMKQP